MQNIKEDKVVKTQIYLQNIGNIDIEADGQGKKLWRARAVTKKEFPNKEESQSREESLKIILQNRRKFAYLDLETIQLSKANRISEISNKCHTFSIASDGWTLCGLKARERPKFVTLTNNFQEIKDIRPHVTMRSSSSSTKRPSKNVCILEKLHRRLVQLYCQIIGRKPQWYQKQAAFPHLASSHNGLAVLCVMQPGLNYIWEYHRTIGHNWKNIDDCKFTTIPGFWSRVFVDKAQIDSWFRKQSSPRVESRILFNEEKAVTGALAYISLSSNHLGIMYAPIDKEGDNFFFNFFKITVQLKELRSRHNGSLTYTARLSTTGKHIAIGINCPFATYIIAFLVTDEVNNEFNAPDKPMQLCQHLDTGLSIYDACNHKHCWIVDLQWIANDTMFSVITNCGSLSIFDSHGESVIIRILNDEGYIKPAIYHQIFQKTHDPAPTTLTYQTIRPPNTEYWRGLTFSLLWSTQQKMLICSSGKTVAFFSFLHTETLPSEDFPVQLDIAPLEAAETKTELENEIQVNILENFKKYFEAGDIIGPSYLMESFNNIHNKSISKELNLLDIIQKVFSQLPVPNVIIRPVKVDLNKSKSFPHLPLHYEFRKEMESSGLSKAISDQARQIDVRFSENELMAKISQSLPDLHVLFDMGNGNIADDEHSDSDLEASPVSENAFPIASVSNLCTNVEGEPAKFPEKPQVMAIEIPAVPKIHNVVPLINYKEYQDSEAETQIPASSSLQHRSSGTQTIIDSNYMENVLGKPENNSSLQSEVIPESVKPLTPTISRANSFINEYRSKHKHLPMIPFLPFLKLSDTLGSGGKEISVSSYAKILADERIAMEAAQKKVAPADTKSNETEKVVSIFQEELESNINKTKYSYYKYYATTPQDIDGITTKPGITSDTRNQNTTAFNGPHEKTKHFLSRSSSISPSQKKYKSLSTGKLNYNTRPTPKKQTSLILSKPKVVSYDHILPRVNTFNLSYIASSNSAVKAAKSNSSNQKVVNGIKCGSDSPRRSISTLNPAKNSCRPSVKVSKPPNKEIATKKTNRNAKEKVGENRANFYDDSFRLVEDFSFYDNYPRCTMMQPKQCYNNAIDPPSIVRAANKWVSNRANNPEGFEMIAKSGRCIQSRSSSSVRSASSGEIPSDWPEINKPKLRREKVVTFELLVNNNEEQQEAPTSAETAESLPSNTVINNTDTIGKEKQSTKVSKEPRGTKLVIREEECEQIPLRSILNQNTHPGNKCSRKVSFCEPIALYKTISPFDVRQDELYPAADDHRTTVFKPKKVKTMLPSEDSPKR